MSKLTEQQLWNCWSGLGIILGEMEIRQSDGRLFKVSDIPGFKEFALSVSGKSMLRRETLCWNEFRQALGLPLFVKVHGGERGKEYPCWTLTPTPKELENLAKRKAGGEA